MEDRPAGRRPTARLLAAAPALALLGLAAGGPGTASAKPPSGIPIDVLGLVQLAIPLTMGGSGLGTGAQLEIPGVLDLSAPVGTSLGSGALAKAAAGLGLKLPVLSGLQLPLPVFSISVPKLLGGLPLGLSITLQAVPLKTGPAGAGGYDQSPGAVFVNVGAAVGSGG
jgi:hypothetical protein